MLRSNSFLALFVVAFLMLSGCNSNKNGQTKKERQDSLEQVRRQRRRDSLARARKDSMARVRADSMAKAKRDQTRETGPAVSFTPQGRYALQVGSWRSHVKAEKRVNMWKKRGYDSATIVQHGNQKTGDVWFRVRLGRLKNRHQAKQLQKTIKQKYREETWVELI